MKSMDMYNARNISCKRIKHVFNKVRLSLGEVLTSSKLSLDLLGNSLYTDGNFNKI